MNRFLLILMSAAFFGGASANAAPADAGDYRFGTLNVGFKGGFCQVAGGRMAVVPSEMTYDGDRKITLTLPSMQFFIENGDVQLGGGADILIDAVDASIGKLTFFRGAMSQIASGGYTFSNPMTLDVKNIKMKKKGDFLNIEFRADYPSDQGCVMRFFGTYK